MQSEPTAFREIRVAATPLFALLLVPTLFPWVSGAACLSPQSGQPSDQPSAASRSAAVTARWSRLLAESDAVVIVEGGQAAGNGSNPQQLEFRLIETLQAGNLQDAQLPSRLVVDMPRQGVSPRQPPAGRWVLLLRRSEQRWQLLDPWLGLHRAHPELLSLIRASVRPASETAHSDRPLRLTRQQSRDLAYLGIDATESAVRRYLGQLRSVAQTEALARQYLSQLQADSFQVRDQATQKLIELGELAHPVLHPAQRSKDVEVRFRIERILRGPQRDRQNALAGVLRVAAEHGLAPQPGQWGLIAQNCRSEGALREFVRLIELAPNGVREAGPIEANSLAESVGLRLLALYQLPIAELRSPASQEIDRVFLDDRDPQVRLYASRRLLPYSPHACLETLVELLAADVAEPRYLALKILSQATGEEFAFQPFGSEAERAESLERWKLALERREVRVIADSIELPRQAVPLPGQFVGELRVEAHRRFGGHTYLIMRPRNRGMKWFEGQQAAESLNGSLAAIGSEKEQAFLADMQREVNYLELWIGLNDQIEEGQWRWTNGEAVRFTKWDRGEPNNRGSAGEDVVMMRPGGLWSDLSVEDTRPACLIELPH